MNKIKKEAEINKSAPHIYAGLSFAKVENMDADDVMRRVIDVFEVTEHQVKSKIRKHEYVMARTAYSFILLKGLKMGLTRIGKSINRDHSTIDATRKRHYDWYGHYERYTSLFNSIFEEGETIKSYYEQT